MLERFGVWWDNLNENYRRMIMALAFSLVIVILLYLVYIIFFKSAREVEPVAATPVTVGGGATLPINDIRAILEREGILPATSAAGLRPTLPPLQEVLPDKIANGGMTLTTPALYAGASSATMDPDGNLKYYNQDDGKFYQIVDGQSVALSDRVFPEAEDVTWSPKGSQAILEFPDSSNVYYDFTEDKQYTLPKEGSGFGFNATGDEIGYKYITNDAANNWLVVSSPTGDKSLAVEHIGNANPDDVLVNWSPDNSRVGMYRQSSGLEQEEVLFVGTNQENFPSLKVNGRGFTGVWSPQSDTLIYSIYSAESGYRPELWISNVSEGQTGVNQKNLGIRTWADKCTFSSNNADIYCAVPLYLEQGSGIYPELATGVPDVIYKINSHTGFKRRVAVPTNSTGVGLYSINQMMLSPDEKSLYLVDQNGGILEMQLSN